jgi:hypothetical protein
LIATGSTFWFSSVKSSEAIGLHMPPPPPPPLVRAMQTSQHPSKVKFANTFPIKDDRITYKLDRIDQFDPIISSFMAGKIDNVRIKRSS